MDGVSRNTTYGLCERIIIRDFISKFRGSTVLYEVEIVIATKTKCLLTMKCIKVILNPTL